MGKYKGEGYSTTFNLGIRTVLRRKQMKDGRLLQLASLSPTLKAIFYIKDDQLVCAKTWSIPRDPPAKRDQDKTIRREYNFYKKLLMSRKLMSFDGIDLI